jgi:AbrB family looped-hinge helix DNA binding protein
LVGEQGLEERQPLVLALNPDEPKRGLVFRESGEGGVCYLKSRSSSHLGHASRWEYMWNGLNEATMDSKGRIVIPEDVRRELGLNEGSRIRVRLEKGGISGGSAVILTKSLGPVEFIKRTEGTLNGESRARAVDPLRLKEIWGGT